MVLQLVHLSIGPFVHLAVAFMARTVMRALKSCQALEIHLCIFAFSLLAHGVEEEREEGGGTQNAKND